MSGPKVRLTSPIVTTIALRARDTAGSDWPQRDFHHRAKIGAELPGGIYRTIVFSYAWIIIVAWLAFGRGTETDYLLFIAGVVFTMMLGLPAISRHTEEAFTHSALQKRAVLGPQDKIDTFTGSLTRTEAILQILLIPVALALLATAMAIVFSIMHP